ncbi:MAG: ACP S-malonyltransferase [Planctomycetota bacterium]|jgi:[acyl-carrier-protein] S-malonyltransferase
MSQTPVVILCPGQGAQAVGMGKAWCEVSPGARRVFDEADAVLGDSLGAPLSELCFEGPADQLNRTDVAQPALYTCSVASYRAMVERDGELPPGAAAGLSLGEYTALHLAGVFDFADGLRLVARRGKLMQDAAQAATSSMVALTGADEEKAHSVCETAAEGEVLVCANFNAPGQIVLSGHSGACERAVAAAQGLGLRATPLTVAGAFHSPIMQSAADGMSMSLAEAVFQPPQAPVWSNVTARPHDSQDVELLKKRLVEQIVSPVQWSETCRGLAGGATMEFHELAPGAVLRGLMRRIDRNVKVISHDQP